MPNRSTPLSVSRQRRLLCHPLEPAGENATVMRISPSRRRDASEMLAPGGF
jgi:hypothetical protein